MSIFTFKEHECLCEAEQKEFNDFASLDVCPKLHSKPQDVTSVKGVEYLGIIKDGEFLKAHYYIGASWFIKDKCAFIVKPKVEVDYIKLFMTALEMNSENEAAYFSNYYYIDFEKPAIKTNALDNVITPLLILHYISLLKHLVSKGLKKGYVVKEENLQSKIRGRILLQRHLTKNVFAKREDRVYCRFQEFTEDIPENRILKKALSFSVRFINQYNSFKNHLQELTPLLSVIGSAFENVSEEVTIAQVAKVNAGKIFRHYESAIKVAKLILRHFDYSIDKASGETQEVRPFCIDMPRLYEMYVLSLLRKAYGDQIKFQVKGCRKTQVDYIKVSDDEKLIIDAKYKPQYNEGNRGILDDIREISGYARDEKILKALGWNAEAESAKGNYFPKCLIIYPDPNIGFKREAGDSEEESDESKMEEIKNGFQKDGILSDTTHIRKIPGFRDFYKIAVPLPTV
ncbi:TonB-dependent receptor [Candidatus Saccharibacteria bacterium]|nr:TonB-dependent receptor [Candidatus Saccharibacteria bacterium]